MFGHGKDKDKLEASSREDSLLRQILEELQDLTRQQRIFNKLQAGTLVVLEHLNAVLTPALTSARLSIMPATIPVGGVANAVINGLDQNGQPFVLDATYKVVYRAATPADVDFGAPNPDGSCQITGVGVDAGDAIVADITRPDGFVITTSSDTLTIVPATATPVLTSATLSLTAAAVAAAKKA